MLNSHPKNFAFLNEPNHKFFKIRIRVFFGLIKPNVKSIFNLLLALVRVLGLPVGKILPICPLGFVTNGSLVFWGISW